MKRLVLKFGGTSVGSIEKIQKVANIIKKRHEEGNEIIVIVSAMFGVTNDLKKKSNLISKNFDNKELDVLLSSGEQISSSLLSGAIIDLGIKARSWMGWQLPILTDGNHTSSQKINKTVAKVEDPYEEIDMEAWEKGQENDFFATTRKERFAKKGDELKTDNTIYAVIQGDQIVKHRSRVNLRLSKDAIINGEIFKKNTMFYATATIQYNRLNLKITNIAHEKVDLNVYDGQDGAVGLYVETPNIASAVGNGVTEDVIDETDASNIPFGNTIKNIFSKKQKEERIQLLNNTKLILMP